LSDEKTKINDERPNLYFTIIETSGGVIIGIGIDGTKNSLDSYISNSSTSDIPGNRKCFGSLLPFFQSVGFGRCPLV
jgi:hypothetical protein